ncbi:contractile injection system protein, VgrG/Pvc8 family [Pelotomaculum sp. PtaB.Bin117]|uniref:phage late control D family protein n=1 Tax=Pelotomaculum sp. PtaB.Bin117 TaxID=1811694 RepID=UPI0009CB2C19|nr:contractile injection system protein, VgrG/Pvc8 family [Pelotomaculum sp. PtaB.Bin117]OPX90392.1 MAG: Phage late control gene D protein (GPD) [Pelotomaculum sp. PtaB.Bin117]
MKNDLYYRISIKAGSASYDLSNDLSSLTVEEGSAGPDKLTIEMTDPFKVYSHALQEGMQVETDLGTVSDHSVIFRGRISKVEGSFPRHGVPKLRLLAFDRSMNMGMRKRNRVWTDTTLEKIVKDIAGAYFDTGNIRVDLKGNSNFSGNGIRQQDETDLAFLLRLAAAYGCEMFVVSGEQKDELYFKASYKIMKSDPEVTLYHGRAGVANCLLTFEATVDAAKIQLPRVFAGTDFDTGQCIQQVTAPVEDVGATADLFTDENLTQFYSRYPARALSIKNLLSAASIVQQRLRDELGSVEREITPGFTTQDELNKRADNQFSTSIRGMRASGSASGNHRIHAQSTIKIANVGGRFSGTWYLSQVRHVLNKEGYQTEFQCQR